MRMLSVRKEWRNQPPASNRQIFYHLLFLLFPHLEGNTYTISILFFWENIKNPGSPAQIAKRSRVRVTKMFSTLLRHFHCGHPNNDAISPEIIGLVLIRRNLHIFIFQTFRTSFRSQYFRFFADFQHCRMGQKMDIWRRTLFAIISISTHNLYRERVPQIFRF